jgi:hypothetical protein
MTDKNSKAEGQTEPQTQGQMASEHLRDKAGLQHRYGTIGIEAVAAAVRCSNFGKKPAEPQIAPRIDQRFEQAV